MVNSRIYTVTQLNQEIKNLLESNPPFFNIFVQGEISNYRPNPSGHIYMTIKDAGAAVNAVMFRSDAVRLKFCLQNGMKIVARGRIGFFQKSGQVQVYLTDMMPDGAGMLHIQFEQLKEKLYQQGLFEQSHKQPLPMFPENIALITSPSGAAVHDMLRILARRWPLAKVQIVPALVQGKDAPVDLVRALQLANAYHTADVIIIGRGGGSLEDLWAFNEECVARAIYASHIPVISAVGHEPDVTISDFVADLRAPTPSGAAELAVPDCREIKQQVDALKDRLYASFKQKCRRNAAMLDTLEQRLAFHTSIRRVNARKETVKGLTSRLLRAISMLLQQKNIASDYTLQQMIQAQKQRIFHEKSRFSQQVTALDVLSPLKVLSRGYAVAGRADGEIITNALSLSVGEEINIRFAHGSADCKVYTIKEIGGR